MLPRHRVKLACPPSTGIRFTSNERPTNHHQLSPSRSSTFPLRAPPILLSSSLPSHLSIPARLGRVEEKIDQGTREEETRLLSTRSGWEQGSRHRFFDDLTSPFDAAELMLFLFFEEKDTFAVDSGWRRSLLRRFTHYSPSLHPFQQLDPTQYDLPLSISSLFDTRTTLDPRAFSRKRERDT